MSKIKHRVLYLYSYGTLALAFGTLFLILFWSLYPYKLMDFYSYKIGDKFVTQGDITYYEIKYCKYTDLMPVIHKEFVDGIIFNAEEKRPELRKGCGTQVIPVHIPETLPAGTYKLRVTASYKVNPVRTINYVNETDMFTVREAK